MALSGSIVDVGTQASAELHWIRLCFKPIFLHFRSLSPIIEPTVSPPFFVALEMGKSS